MFEIPDIKIMAAPTQHEHVCEFIVDHPIYPGKTVNCRTPEMAKGSPLLEALFGLGGITQVMLKDSVVTIEKSTDDPWSVLAKKVGATIRELIKSGTDLVAEDLEPNSTHSLLNDQEILSAVQVILGEQVNPSLASHGGYAEVLKVEESDVYLMMGGGCQGCGAASYTLQMSIERTLRTAVPQIRKIIDATDHSAGTNPYY